MATCLDKILCENSSDCNITILDIDGNPVDPVNLNDGDSIIIVLGDKPGYRFIGWTDETGKPIIYDTVDENHYIIRSIDCKKQYIAKYCAILYNVNVTSDSTCLQPYGTFATYGKIVKIQASDGMHCRFLYWTKNGVLYSYQKSFDYIVTENTTFEAFYDDIKYRITAKPNLRNRGVCTGSGLYDYNDEATITATPNKGYKFDAWDDGFSAPTRTVPVRGNKTYIALFSVI